MAGEETFMGSDGDQFSFYEECGEICLEQFVDYNDVSAETAITIGEKLIELGRAVIARREEAGNDPV